MDESRFMSVACDMCGASPCIGCHVWGCDCARCRAMIAAICAVDRNGDPFFTDAELEQLAEAK